MPIVTVVICTYNRPALLEKCLHSLREQTLAPGNFSVLVVDNYGCEKTHSITHDYKARYVREPKTGLSNARNRGASESSTPWVFYLDDDGIASPDMLARFQQAIKETSCRVIGGKYEHYFADVPPKWVVKYYRDPVRASPGSGTVALSAGQYLSGGIMASRKEILIDYPFKSSLGMKGLKPGFGEENEWQDRLRKDAIPVYYNDSISMTHLVQRHKQTVRDRLDLAYAHGRYHFLTKETPAASASLMHYFLICLATFVKAAPYDLARILFKPGFYWQNAVISTVGKLAFTKGKYGR